MSSIVSWSNIILLLVNRQLNCFREGIHPQPHIAETKNAGSPFYIVSRGDRIVTVKERFEAGGCAVRRFASNADTVLPYMLPDDAFNYLVYVYTGSSFEQR